jgi:hypothetical protein
MKLIKGFIFIANIFRKKLLYGNSIGGSATAIVAIVLFILKVAIEG